MPKVTLSLRRALLAVAIVAGLIWGSLGVAHRWRASQKIREYERLVALGRTHVSEYARMAQLEASKASQLRAVAQKGEPEERVWAERRAEFYDDQARRFAAKAAEFEEYVTLFTGRKAEVQRTMNWPFW